MFDCAVFDPLHQKSVGSGVEQRHLLSSPHLLSSKTCRDCVQGRWTDGSSWRLLTTASEAGNASVFSSASFVAADDASTVFPAGGASEVIGVGGEVVASPWAATRAASSPSSFFLFLSCRRFRRAAFSSSGEGVWVCERPGDRWRSVGHTAPCHPSVSVAERKTGCGSPRSTHVCGYPYL